MTTINQNLDRIERQAGVDVTRLAGKHVAASERLIEAKAAVEDMQTVERCREYVAAYDALQALLKASMAWRAA